jgi:hypothetical protein
MVITEVTMFYIAFVFLAIGMTVSAWRAHKTEQKLNALGHMFELFAEATMHNYNKMHQELHELEKDKVNH